MYNTSFIKKFLLAVTAVFLYSCDKDYNAIGEELIGDNHFDLVPEQYDVVAYNQEVTPVQSNGLPLYGLGIFDNPVFGVTTANFVAQVGLETYAPTIGDFTVVKSVVLTVPYASHATGVDSNGGNTYVLDSIYGNKKDGRIKLSVYESGIQMYGSSFENGNQITQLYYSDQDSNTASGEINFNAKKIGDRLNNDADKNQNDNFFFDATQITTSTTDASNVVTKTYSAPKMRLNLNKQFFIDKILKAPAAKLASSLAFQEYFRGIYFRAEQSGTSPSNMALLDFYKATDPAKITINYRAKTVSTTDNDTITEAKTLVINLAGNSAGLLQDTKSANYANAINAASINKTAGDERLYLKGGQGSLAVVNLFGGADLYSYDANGVKVDGPNGVSDQLDDIKNNVKTKHWLVNEANLVFYVDGDKMGATQQPKRLYLYDLDNNTVIADYIDGTPTSSNDPKATRTVYGGILNVDATKGNSYKIRVTKHIRNLIKDETGTIKNVKLGLSVTEGIDIITMNKLKLKNDVFSQVPTGSVMGPLGTILYGGTASVPADKRIKLEIYYTKPN